MTEQIKSVPQNNTRGDYLLASILTIALLGILAFFINAILNPQPRGRLSQGCIPTSGFYCASPILSTGGNLSFALGQSLGTYIYNVALACVVSINNSGSPEPPRAIVLINANGVASNQIASNANTPLVNSYGGALSIVSGQTIIIQGLKCYGSNGAALESNPGFVYGIGYNRCYSGGGCGSLFDTSNAVNTLPLGTAYGGSIFINYTTGPGTINQTNAWKTQRIITVSVKVSKVGV